MNIFVFSDSHSNCDYMNSVIRQNIKDCDYIIHLGDNVHDTSYIERNSGVIPVLKIIGNNDWYNRDPYASEIKFLELYGRKFMICHGHKYGVKSSYSSLYDAAKAYGCDIVLFGHTHRSDIEMKDGITLFNPGSIGEPRDKKYTYGIINIDENNIKYNICEATL